MTTKHWGQKQKNHLFVYLGTKFPGEYVLYCILVGYLYFIIYSLEH